MRWLRAGALGSVTLLTGTVAHATAGGLLPTPTLMAVLLVVSIAVTAVFLGRTASIGLLVGLLAGGQTVIHLVLSVVAGHAGEPPQQVSWTFDGLLDLGGALAGDLSVHAPMMMAHLVAATGVALWLAVGEQALWRVLHSLAVIVLRPLLRALIALRGRRQPAPTSIIPVFHDPVLLPAHLPVLARSVIRRGPPLALAA